MQDVADESLEGIAAVRQDLDEVHAQDVDVRQRAYLLRTEKMIFGRAIGHWWRVCFQGACPQSIELSLPGASIGLHKVVVCTRRRCAIRRCEYYHFAKFDHLRTRLLRCQYHDTQCETDDCCSPHAGSIVKRRVKGNG
jgi:hypothetical protein